MNSILSSIVFIFSFFMYIHIRHYYSLSSDRDIIVFDNTGYLSENNLFYKILGDTGRAKISCIFKNTSILGTIEMETNTEITYSNLLKELGSMVLCVPFTYATMNEHNNKSELHNVYMTIEAADFIVNDIDVESRALCFNEKVGKNHKIMSEEQRAFMKVLYNSIDKYAYTYLYNQHIVKRAHMLYFSNSETQTYIELQAFKDPLTIFCVLCGECEVLIIHPDYVNMSYIKDDYVFFRFYFNKNVFENDNLNDLLNGNIEKINKIKCTRGDVVLVPRGWFISVKMREKCVILNESISTATSVIGLIPEYIKNILFRSAVRVVPKKICEIIDNTDDLKLDTRESLDNCCKSILG